MAELTMPGTVQPASAKPSLDGGFNPLTIIIFCGFLAAGMLFTATVFTRT
jgi:PiT family inorganic phosphate transporter